MHVPLAGERKVDRKRYAGKRIDIRLLRDKQIRDRHGRTGIEGSRKNVSILVNIHLPVPSVGGMTANFDPSTIYVDDPINRYPRGRIDRSLDSKIRRESRIGYFDHEQRLGGRRSVAPAKQSAANHLQVWLRQILIAPQWQLTGHIERLRIQAAKGELQCADRKCMGPGLRRFLKQLSVQNLIVAIRLKITPAQQLTESLGSPTKPNQSISHLASHQVRHARI